MAKRTSTQLTLPGFTAEMSLYDTRTAFHLLRHRTTLPGLLIPAQDDDWDLGGGRRCYKRCMSRAQESCLDRCFPGEIDVEPEL